jgi:hypothetical protein
MPRAKPKLNNSKAEVVHQAFLAETPEGFEEPQAPDIVISHYVPEYRRIQFINGRDPGQELMFHYHSKTHPLKHYTLFHGKEYDLPVEIIDHLETRVECIYGYRPGPSGHPEMYVKGHKYPFSCKTVRADRKVA